MRLFYFKKFFCVNIINSDLGHHYIGQTIDFDARLRRHNEGRSKATGNKGIWKLVVAAKVNSRSEPMKLKNKLKKMKNAKKAIDY